MKVYIIVIVLEVATDGNFASRAIAGARRPFAPVNSIYGPRCYIVTISRILADIAFLGQIWTERDIREIGVPAKTHIGEGERRVGGRPKGSARDIGTRGRAILPLLGSVVCKGFVLGLVHDPRARPRIVVGMIHCGGSPGQRGLLYLSRYLRQLRKTGSGTARSQLGRIRSRSVDQTGLESARNGIALDVGTGAGGVLWCGRVDVY